MAVNDNLDRIAVENLPDRPAGQRLGRDVADAGSGRYSAEARVRHNSDVLAEIEVLQRRSYLVRFFHSRAHRSAADEDNYVAGLDIAALDRRDRPRLGGENTGRTALAIDAVGIDDSRINGRALDHRTFRRKI